MLERLNKEIRRRKRVIGIFPNSESYFRLVTTYLIEYAEDWLSYLSAKSIHDAFSNAACFILSE